MRILTSEQMREADRHAIEELGIPSLVLMETAAREVVRALEDLFGDLSQVSFLVLCGTGNNGGDGLACARILDARGSAVLAVVIGDPASMSPDADTQWSILRKLGVPAKACGPREWPQVRDELDQVDVVIDALLGTGFHGVLEGFLAEVVEDVNASPAPVVAVDVPSGLSGSSAELSGPAVRASLTVTFAAPKVCHVFAPAHEHCGDLVVADIGIPDKSVLAAGPGLELTDGALVAELVEDLVDRDEDTHKGTWGHVLVVGGAVGRSGAPAMTGLAALMAGCGLSTVATPAPCVASVAAHAPELMQVALPAGPDGAVADGAGAALEEALARATVLAIGPGLGTGEWARRLVEEILRLARVPVVLDADALNVLASIGRLPEPVDERPLVLTPHPGEFERLIRALTGRDVKPGPSQRIEEAERLAVEHGVVVLLKGFRTIIAAPGHDVHVNPTGGPGLGTAGTGDVLTGIVAGLMAQRLSAWEAAVAGAYLHGRAGDLGEKAVGQPTLRATDILRNLPAAFRSLAPAEDEDGAED